MNLNEERKRLSRVLNLEDMRRELRPTDMVTVCTDYGFLGHSLKEDCAIMTILIERSIQWPNAEDSPLSLKLY